MTTIKESLKKTVSRADVASSAAGISGAAIGAVAGSMHSSTPGEGDMTDASGPETESAPLRETAVNITDEAAEGVAVSVEDIARVEIIPENTDIAGIINQEVEIVEIEEVDVTSPITAELPVEVDVETIATVSVNELAGILDGGEHMAESTVDTTVEVAVPTDPTMNVADAVAEIMLGENILPDYVNDANVDTFLA